MPAANIQVNNGVTVNKHSLTGWMLVAVLVVYGVFSMPFPDEYGIPELIIGVLLILVCMGQAFTFFVNIGKTENFAWLIPFVWMLVVPSFIGIVRWDIGDIIRDIVPLFYLFLPVILIPWAKKINDSDFVRKFYVSAMVIAGSGFALKYFTTQEIGYEDLGSGVFMINLKYYSYDPTVTFTAIFGLLFALMLFQSASKGKYLAIILYIAVSLLAVGALGGIAQRAPLAILFLCLVTFMFRYARKSLMLVCIFIIFLLAIIVYFQDVIFPLYSLLVEKSEAVGVNGKVDEIELIINILTDSWFNTLFGLGWGGIYYNTVLSSEIRFSHSVLGFYLLKTGFIGTAVMSLYAIWLIKRYVRVFAYTWRNDVTQLPLLFAIGSAPIIAMLQPTYKTLSFGLILTLIPVLYFEMQVNLNKKLSKRK